MKQIITGMGRSGTKWISEFLNCQHESSKIENLFYEIRSGIASEKDIKKKIKELVDSWPEDYICVNSYFKNMVPIFRSLDVKCFYLIRNPKDLIKSYFNKHVLQEKEERKKFLPKEFYTSFTDEEITDETWEQEFFRVKVMTWLYNFNYRALLTDCDVPFVFVFDRIVSDKEYAKHFCESLGYVFYEDKWYKLRNKHINRTHPLDKKLVWKPEYTAYINEHCKGFIEAYKFEVKDENEKRYAMNIGCGEEYHEEDDEYIWINIDSNKELDADDHIDFAELDKKYKEKFHFIEAKDVLEHIPFTWIDRYKWVDTLAVWCKCLAMDGVIRIQTTDLYHLMDLLLKGEIDEVEYNRRVYDERLGNGDIHYQMFSIGRLRRVLTDIGMRVERYQQLNGNIIMEARRVQKRIG